MKMKNMFWLVFLFLLAPAVLAGGVYTIFSPVGVEQTEFSISTTTSVNFTWSLNVTDDALDPGNSLNCTVMNTSGSSANNYSQLLVSFNVTNGTIINKSLALKDGIRSWWYINCTTRGLTGNANSTYLTSTSAVNVDTNYFNVPLGQSPGVINLSYDTGSAKFKGQITADNVTIKGTLTTANFTVTGLTSISGIVNALEVNTTNLTVTGFVDGNLTLGTNYTNMGVQAAFIALYNNSATWETCTYSYPPYGQIRLNQSSGRFHACNGTVWARLNT